MKARTANYNTYYGEGGIAKFLVEQLDKFYDMGKVGNALQKISPTVGNYLSKNMLELVGDMSVVSRAAKAGVQLNSSVFTRAMTRWGKTYDEWVTGFDDLYVKYATGQSDSTKVGSLNLSDLTKYVTKIIEGNIVANKTVIGNYKKLDSNHDVCCSLN